MPQLITVPDRSSRPQAHPTAPLVEATLEPGPVHLRDLVAFEGVVDADPVEQGGPATNAPARLGADVSWPCICGVAVPLEQNTCPDCGSKFLGELHEGGSGKHRRHAERSWWPATRGLRIALALLMALLLAVGVPTLLSLLG